MFKRIYVPIDHSDVSMKVLHEAMDLVESSSAKLKIAHVINLEQISFGIEMVGVAELKDTLIAVGQKFVGHLKDLVQKRGLQAEIVLIENYGAGLSKLIIEDAKTWDADLFVIGSHHLGSFTHLITGGIAEDISHESNIPILLIPKHK